MTKPIDRAALKAQARELLQTAQVSPKGMTALYCICLFLFSLMEALFPGPELVSTFLSILTTLAGWILAAGFALYCMDIRRRERSEYAVLFDGFSFTGKIIALNIVINLFVFLWSMLFVVPGIIAYYRYRFALYNLYENPDMDIAQRKEETEISQTIASLAKQMINNADIVLRAEKLMGEGKLVNSNIEKMIR